MHKYHKATLTGVALLAVASIPLLLLLHSDLKRREDESFAREYSSMALGLMSAMAATIQHAKSGADQVSFLYSLAYPNASMWPHVFMPMEDFIRTTQPVQDITGVSPIMCPLVLPSQVDSFEAFMQQTYEEDPVTTGDGVGESDFGFGIFAYNYSDPSDSTPPTYSRYHDTTGETSISSHDLIVPLSQTPLYPLVKSEYMKNMHSEPLRGEAIDSVYECAQSGSTSCSALTDMFIPPFRIRPPSPLASFLSLYFTGVFAGNGTLVGVVASPIRWILLITGGVPEEQITDAIFSISTPLSTFTAHIVNGEAVEVLDVQHKSFEKEMSLSSESDDVQYTLRLYPSPEFYDKRHTLLPLITTIVTGLVIFLLLSLVLLNASYLTMQLERDTTQKLVDSKANFIRVISHELRTPLQSLRLGLELLLAEVTPTSPDMRVPDVNSLTEIQEDLAANVDMAVKTLDDLLEYDKLRSGETTLNEEVTLLPILLEVLAPFKRLAERRQIKVTLLFDTHGASSDKGESVSAASSAKDLRVRADSERLRRVFHHIMANTLKCIPDGAVISILLSWRCSGDAFCATHQLGTGKHLVPKQLQRQSILVCFETSGDAVAGIDQNFLLRPDLPFDPDMLQVGQGSGLGLCMSKMIVEDHGGAMWMTAAEDNTGSSIKVELPLVDVILNPFNFQAADVEDPVVHHSLPMVSVLDDEEADLSGGQHYVPRQEIVLNAPSPDATDVEPILELNDTADPVTQRKVLVVDDSPPIRRLLHRVLSKLGANVDVACHGQEAVDMVKASGPDYGCVLMDFEMPVMRGPDATQIIREMGFDSNSLTIVGVTGNTNAEDIDHFKSCGADDVYSKPVGVDVLSGLLVRTHCLIEEEEDSGKKEGAEGEANDA